VQIYGGRGIASAMSRLFILLSALFVFTFHLPANAFSDKIYKELSTLTKIMEVVDQFYVKEADEEKLIQGAIRGMLSSLDPHTVYLSPKIYKHFASDTKGRFGGLGIEVSVRDGVITVIAPLEDTPAWNAGIKAGDKILMINGKTTKNMSLGQAVHIMRGPIGKSVNLTLWREGKSKPRTVSLTRKLIKVSSIRSEDLGDGYVLVRLIQFQDGTSKGLKKVLQEYKHKHGKINGVILDLRDNPGGLLIEAVKVSDLFLKKGVIVSTKDRNKVTEVKKAHSMGTFKPMPIIVMINGGSASASEIVAGALQDHNRAKLAGTKSFGKGSVQTVINLDNGGAIKVTIAHYFTPKDRLIDGKGIEPDIKLGRKLYEKKNKPDEGKQKKVTRDIFYDFQKQEALSYLKKMSR
jgi:carboxyl-terminal processing protease